MKSFFCFLFFLPLVLFSQASWQQHAEYFMDIKMDVSDFTFLGEQTILYTNNSPDTINKVYYHLFFNAFRPGSQMDIRSRTIQDPDRRVGSRIFGLEKKDFGELKVGSIEQNGKKVEFNENETVLVVKLNKPLLPGKKTELKMVFTGQVPLQIRRSGKLNKEGVHLTMTQWFPKLAEYDFEGWHPNPYIGREFHGVWGNYTVNITIDKNYVVGGTGYLQNAKEIGHGYGEKTKKNSDNTLTWKFYAPNVHDFAWAADPDYLHDIITSESGVDLHFLYKNTVNIDDWKKLQGDTLKLLEFFEKNIGPYPWKQYSVIQGGDGGMEYAMCTMITGERSYGSLFGVTAHELAHAWFQHVLATNEAKHPWMDEGFTEYITSLAEEFVNNKTSPFPHKSSYERYYMINNLQKENPAIEIDQPQTVHSDRWNYNFTYGANAYSKGSVFLSQLGYIIGKKNLSKTIKRYYTDFKFKHPTPNDFKRVAEKVSGTELEWYLNDWTRTTNKIDYEIVSYNDKTRGVSLRRIENMPMPIELFITFDDGSKELYYIPTDLMFNYKQFDQSVVVTNLSPWKWANSEYSFFIEDNNKKVVFIEIDPSKRLADIDQKNNVLNISK